MGRYVVKVPDIGEGMTEAEIVAWHVEPGQVIREEDPLVDVMTDKATVELPAPVAGTVVAIHGAAGEKRPVGSELVELDVAGEGNAAAASLIGATGGCSRRTPALSPQAGEGSSRAPASQPLSPPRGEGGPAPRASGASGRAARKTGSRPDGAAARAKSRWPRRRCGARLGARHRAAIRARHRAGRAASPTQDLDAYVAGPTGARPRHAWPGPRATASRRSPIIGLRRAIAERSAGIEAAHPAFLLCRGSRRHRARGIARRSSTRALCRPRAPDPAAVPDPRDRQCRRGAPAGQRPLRRRGRRAAPPPRRACRRRDADRRRADGAGGAPRRGARSVAESPPNCAGSPTAARAGKAAREELTGSTITVTSLGALGGIASDAGHQLPGGRDRRRQPHRRAAGGARRPDRRCAR